MCAEWATAIITAVKKFHTVDNDVAVFGKILRNEIDEEFRFVQKQLKVRCLTVGIGGPCCLSFPSVVFPHGDCVWSNTLVVVYV